MFFSGVGPVSSIVRIASSSEWSHIGVVVRERDFNIHAKTNRVCLLHSSNSSTEPIIEYPGLKAHRGVKLSPLGEYVEKYFGMAVAYKRLSVPDKWRESRFFKERVKRFIDRTIDRPYETNWIEMYHSVSGDNAQSSLPGIYCKDAKDVYYNEVFKGLTDKEFDSMMLHRDVAQELFCVELVVYFYQYLGFVTRERQANNYNLNDLYGSILSSESDRIHFRLEQIHLDRRSIVIEK